MIVGSSAPRVVATTLDDFSWIVNRCLKEPDDIFFFFRELLHHPNIGRLVAFETINAFEHWRDNDKIFLRSSIRDRLVVRPSSTEVLPGKRLMPARHCAKVDATDEAAFCAASLRVPISAETEPRT
jgi:hypothetical protein